MIALPTSPAPAPRAGEFSQYLPAPSRNAIRWNLIGVPAIMVSCGRTRGGLPVGIQFVASPGSEHDLVALGRAAEEVVAAGS